MTRKKKFSMENEMSWKLFGGIVLAFTFLFLISLPVWAFHLAGPRDYRLLSPCSSPYTITDFKGVEGYYIGDREEAIAFGNSIAYIFEAPLPWTMDDVTGVMVFKPKLKFKSTIFFLSSNGCSYDRYAYNLTPEVQELIDLVVGGRWIPISEFKNLKNPMDIVPPREEHRKERKAEGQEN